MSDAAERFLQSVPAFESFDRHLRHLAARPHQTGTPRDLELADYVRDRFLEYGLDEARFHDSPALIPYGRSAALEIVAPVTKRLALAEDPYPGDPDSYLYADPAFVAFHSYAATGEAVADVVYANSGGPEDFATLERLGVPVRGRIVLMRYSQPYSYRGYKVFLAERHGAAGTLIYSDPAEDGYARGPVYPDGPWGPESKVQWGGVIYDWVNHNGPFTFHWKKRGGRWVEGPERDPRLPRIPSLPISHRNAAEILSRLGGPAAPDGWQGALPFPYRLGPGPVRVRLAAENDERIATVRNVIGVLRGAAEPALWVIAGNHRDAWVYGAVDPSSGTAALLEVARALGAAARSGRRPRRTIVLASWSGEEELLAGSTCWARDNLERLRRHGVAYVNVDAAAFGPRLEVAATPSLAGFLKAAAGAVAHPAGHGTVRDAWAAASPGGEPRVGNVVGATDYTAFKTHVGMGCIDLSFHGPYGVYHSMYDDYFWLSRIGDPGFRYNVALARLWAVVLWRLADAAILPVRCTDYTRAIQALIETVEKRGAAGRLRLDAARAALRRWEEASVAFEAALDARLAAARAAPAERAHAGAAPVLPAARIRAVNRLLLSVERALTERRGLPGREFFKHLIYAPQPTCREEFLPRVWEAIDRADWKAVPRHEHELAAAFDRAAGLVTRARRVLDGAAGARRVRRPGAASRPLRTRRGGTSRRAARR